MKPQRRIAIVGGGVSGIGCLWGLRNESFDVHLYEADSRLGGHANTVILEGHGNSFPVDTGFIAMNEKTYPEFTAFLNALNVETIPTDMSFSLSEDEGAFEWGSTTLRAFVGSIFNCFRPWFWRFIFDIIRFNYTATDEYSTPSHSPNGPFLEGSHPDKKHGSEKGRQEMEFESIGDYLDRHGYSDTFKRYFIIPMVAAPWCIDPGEFSRNFPAKTLIQFMANHGLLDTVSRRLEWRTIKYGSRAYIDAFSKSVPPGHYLHLETPIKSCVRQDNGQVQLKLTDGSLEMFDHVVLAVHANQALKILGEGVTRTEYEILRHFRTSENVCILHSDMSLMPRRPNAQASWNCLMQSTETNSKALEEHKQTIESPSELKQYAEESIYPGKISVTFDMNRLQGIPLPGEPGSPGRVLVSMNPIHSPRLTKGIYKYSHPLISAASVLASKSFYKLNGMTNVSFAGAWMGYGFHEDGFAAGLHAAGDITRQTQDCSHASPNIHERVYRAPRWRLRDRIFRAMIEIVQSFIRRK